MPMDKINIESKLKHDSGYLRLFQAMLEIAEGFQTPDELLEDQQYMDLQPEEVLSMVYENMQSVARDALAFARRYEEEREERGE